MPPWLNCAISSMRWRAERRGATASRPSVNQEALIVLLEAARGGRIDDPEHVDRFVLGACRNLISRSRRDARRSRAFEGAVLPLPVGHLPPAFSNLDAARVALCLGTVGAREQRVVLLTFQEERSAEEIATALGTSPGNVRVLRHRAMAAIQRCVAGSAT